MLRETERRFLLLSAGTIFFIQVSCIIEEWIFKQLANFHYHWFVALLELAIFSLFGHLAHVSDCDGSSSSSSGGSGSGSGSSIGGSGSSGSGGSSCTTPARKGPLRLYVLVGLSLAAGTGLGKVAYRYVNYATGTVLKSMKLLPVMAVSVCWLHRSYTRLQVAAAVLMVGSAVCFGLGEAELEPSFHPLGLLLSFGCLVAQVTNLMTSDDL
jgi:solute carrier family 35 (adenosine 3'-phospho 5'-phosphosulfate transporter), member B3